ncbi:tail fiber assembly protein [Burkholderia multivorans]|uniref:tail fiber assembly protein n=1 Tax=Burkholderia multivorans TaxID=87883 RepID=UPI000D000C91|nr:tail fiber assembly protein [Burkholderia multivorans]MBU9163090.1 tail fiber assembly protein [Burkholderia multivorans]MBU9339234.1 tail fiber assembly protein [Burkholderia multivorans]MBU9391794.1 tail fiber assembly protein [Burkholderia multivorans]MBU9443946.1 tail fiber assembly protein [Burkholderia multivorans]MBU9486736.1 tail fiber assembly protein [Burkholderia multivorans]
MLIHQYDAETGQYISSHLADVDPKNPNRWLVPAFSTLDPLPERTPRTWPFYRNGAWTLLPDHRGQVLYRQDTGEPAEILAAGTTPEAQGLTEIPRPSPEHVWRDGGWVIDPALVAQRAREAAMVEFESRMARARQMNAGKADAYAAGLLSMEEVYYFRAWSAYQLDLVRAIQSDGFPETVHWPDDPVPFEVACEPALAEFEARMAKAKSFIDGKANAYAAGELSDEEQYNYRAWSAYADRLTHTLNRETFPNVVWPEEPEPYVAPPAPELDPPAGATASRDAT